jgi:hypothetical protein
VVEEVVVMVRLQVEIPEVPEEGAIMEDWEEREMTLQYPHHKEIQHLLQVVGELELEVEVLEPQVQVNPDQKMPLLEV